MYSLLCCSSEVYGVECLAHAAVSIVVDRCSIILCVDALLFVLRIMWCREVQGTFHALATPRQSNVT
jgi:hypothetical protein